jgi:hypothetical protein
MLHDTSANIVQPHDTQVLWHYLPLYTLYSTPQGKQRQVLVKPPADLF